MGGAEKIKRQHAKGRFTARERIGGEVVGLVASNPIVNMGATDTNALDKMTSFFCLCDS